MVVFFVYFWDRNFFFRRYQIDESIIRFWSTSTRSPMWPGLWHRRRGRGFSGCWAEDGIRCARVHGCRVRGCVVQCMPQCGVGEGAGYVLEASGGGEVRPVDVTLVSTLLVQCRVDVGAEFVKALGDVGPAVQQRHMKRSPIAVVAR